MTEKVTSQRRNLARTGCSPARIKGFVNSAYELYSPHAETTCCSKIMRISVQHSASFASMRVTHPDDNFLRKVASSRGGSNRETTVCVRESLLWHVLSGLWSSSTAVYPTMELASRATAKFLHRGVCGVTASESTIYLRKRRFLNLLSATILASRR